MVVKDIRTLVYIFPRIGLGRAHVRAWRNDKPVCEKPQDNMTHAFTTVYKEGNACLDKERADIDVYIADADPLWSNVITSTLQAIPNIRHIRVERNLMSLFHSYRVRSLDIVIVNTSEKGAHAAAIDTPSLRLVALAPQMDELTAVLFNTKTYLSVLLKDKDLTHYLPIAVQKVNLRQQFLHGSAAAFVHAYRSRATSMGKLLTRKQIKILVHLYEGESLSTVAAGLNCTLSTAKWHTYNIMRKLDLHSLAELFQHLHRR